MVHSDKWYVYYVVNLSSHTDLCREYLMDDDDYRRTLDRQSWGFRVSYDGNGHEFAFATNLEVLSRALCLRAPVAVRGHTNHSEAVDLFPERLHRNSTASVLGHTWGRSRVTMKGLKKLSSIIESKEFIGDVIIKIKRIKPWAFLTLDYIWWL